MKRDDRELLEQLEQSARKLNGAELITPDIQYFRSLVDAHQAKLRRAQKRQFMLFIASAAIIVSAMLFCLHRYQTVFLVVQCATAVVAVLSLLYSVTRRPGEGYQ